MLYQECLLFKAVDQFPKLLLLSHSPSSFSAMPQENPVWGTVALHNVLPRALSLKLSVCLWLRIKGKGCPNSIMLWFDIHLNSKVTMWEVFNVMNTFRIFTSLLVYCQDYSAATSIWSEELSWNNRMATLEHPLISNWLSGENCASVAGYLVTNCVVYAILAINLCVSLPKQRG